MGCNAVMGFEPGESLPTSSGGEGGAGLTGTAGAGAAGGTSAGGSAGQGGAGAALPEPRSCDAGLPGAGLDCGAEENDDCCATSEVPGGTYIRAKQFCEGLGIPTDRDATVSPFRLDKYEVTVGRFRAFVAAYDDTEPAEGYGAHERIADSGWRSEWPHPTKADVLADAHCTDTHWTDTPEDGERMPMNCVSWYTAFLFCAWDHGRLPTEAEWNFAAAAGDQHRLYPWGSADPDDTLVVYTCEGCPEVSPEPVGSRPLGAGHWGHLDLAGNLAEWNLDVSMIGIAGFGYCGMLFPCVDCAVLAGNEDRVRRGGHFAEWFAIRADVRRGDLATGASRTNGIRCARPSSLP